MFASFQAVDIALRNASILLLELSVVVESYSAVLPQEALEASAPSDATDAVTVITQATFIFFLYLLLALFVERILEIAVAVYNRIEAAYDGHEFWNEQATKLRMRLERMSRYHRGDKPMPLLRALHWTFWQVVTESKRSDGRRIVSAKLIRLQSIRLATRVLAFVLALGLVTVLWQTKGFTLLGTVATFYEASFEGALVTVDAVNLVVSAAAISIGTEPLHRLITRVERLKPESSSTGEPTFLGGTS